MNNKLEKAIKRLKNIVDKCKIEIKEIGYECDLYDGDEPIPYKEIETVLNYIDNSISKEIIEEKLDNLDLDYEIQQKWDELDGSTAVTKAYKELLKGK